MRKIALLALVIFSAQLSAQQRIYENKTRSLSAKWEDYFMPGLGYKSFLPNDHKQNGVFQGVNTEIIFYALARTNNSSNDGPSRVKFYGNLGILKSNKETVKDLFLSNLGINLSFEGQAKRRFLIPYFGVETGGTFQGNFASFNVTPVGGIQLISTHRIIWDLQGGYQYTIKDYENKSGFLASSTINLLLWND